MFEVRMPQKGLTETSAYLSKWYVKVGDTVKTGDYLFAMETSKSVFDVEAEEAGTVIAILYEEGDEVEIEKVVCVLGAEGEKYEGAAEEPAAAPAAEETAPAPAAVPEAVPAAAPAPAAPAAATELPPEGVRVAISPRAKGKAEELGISYRGITPTGPEGRIIEEDVVKAYESGAAVPAESMAAAAAAFGGQAPFFGQPVAAPLAPGADALPFAAPETKIVLFDAGELLAYAASVAGSDVTLRTKEDMILYAVSRTAAQHPEMAKGMPVFFAQQRGAYYYLPALDVNAGWSLGVGAPKKEWTDGKDGECIELKTIALSFVYDTRAFDRDEVDAFIDELVTSLENFSALLAFRA